MSNTTPIQTLSLDEAAQYFADNNTSLTSPCKNTENSSLYIGFVAGVNYNEAKRQVVAIDEVELRKKASEAWEVENKYHPNGINPTAFEFGYKVGYKAALKNK